MSLLFWLPVTVFITYSGSAENHTDEHDWHLPAIRLLADKWPAINIRTDSISASAPGYHWLLAALAKVTDGGVVPLRVANAMMSYLLVVLLYLYIRKRVASLHAALFIAPLAASSHFTKQAAWIMTDNAGLLLATATLLLALKPTASVFSFIGLSFLGTATVFTRQIHGWILAAMVAKCFLASSRDGASWTHPRVARFLLTSTLVVAPSLLVLVLLYLSWGGLVPPQFGTAAGISLASQCYLLTLFGMFGMIYLGADLRDYLRTLSSKTMFLGVLVIFALSLTLTIPTGTSYDFAEGRWGGLLWPIIRLFPNIDQRSTFFFLTVPIGLFFVAVYCGVTARSGARHETLILAFSLTAWIVSFIVSKQAFHRYFEPLIIIFMALSAALRFQNRLPSRRMLMALGTLAALQLLLTFGLFFANFVLRSDARP